MTVTQNNGTATTFVWTAATNAAFTRLDNYIDAVYANGPNGDARTNAQRKKAFIREEVIQMVKSRMRNREGILALAAITDPDGAES